MLSSLKLLNEVLVLFVALVAGLFVFGRMDKFQRLMFWQLVLWMFFLAASYSLIAWQRSKGYSLNSHVVHNLYIPPEAALLCTAVSVRLRRTSLRWAATGGFVIICTFFVLSVVKTGLSVYAHYADVAACFVYSFLFGMTTYHVFREKGDWWRNPDIYISAGIFIYAACSVPYITAFDFLQTNYPALSKTLFHLVSDVLANVRYLLLALGFWLIKRY